MLGTSVQAGRQGSFVALFLQKDPWRNNALHSLYLDELAFLCGRETWPWEEGSTFCESLWHSLLFSHSGLRGHNRYDTASKQRFVLHSLTLRRLQICRHYRNGNHIQSRSVSVPKINMISCMVSNHIIGD